ncbi:MAG TPA: hypothetical protein VK923_11105 [Euzebyales bacterium]|nr:hypothetical protein [Euzebyales bacterium]
MRVAAEVPAARPAQADDLSQRAARAVAEYDRQAVFDHDMADDGEVGDAVWDDEVDDDGRRIVVTGTTPPAVDGQLQIDRDDTGRLLLDVPAQAPGKEVWTQIITAVQQAGQVPTQRELADELNVSRSRVRRAIERNRDEWNDLVEHVEDRAVQEPVTAGGSRRR